MLSWDLVCVLLSFDVPQHMADIKYKIIVNGGFGFYKHLKFMEDIGLLLHCKYFQKILGNRNYVALYR